MQKIVLILVFLLKISYSVFAQDTAGCNCTSVLKEVILDIEHKYPGFKDKTKGDNGAKYIALKELIISEAGKVETREACFYKIERYLAFFKDNHLIFTDRITVPGQNPDTKINDEAQSVDQLTGTWRRSSDSLTIKVLKQSARQNTSVYRAYVLQTKDTLSKKGDIYFDLLGNENEFRIRKYTTTLTNALWHGRRLNNLLIEPDGVWEKIIPGKSNIPVKNSAYSTNNKFRYQSLNKNIYYIGIPSFSTDPEIFDSLIVNKIIPAIVNNKTQHLIIDLRNNVGGNSSFLSLTRLIYERPFSIPGDFVFSTPDMISRYEKSAKAGSAYHKMMLPKLIANPGGFVQRDSLKLALKEIYQWPKNITVLVNENCASSTEYFLVLAKHSSKVKIYGRHTAGTLDYIDLFQPEKLSCPGYVYMRPTVKSSWTDSKPIDNKGINPDVDLSSYPDNEWVDILIHDLK